MQMKKMQGKAKVPKLNPEWLHQCAMAQWAKNQKAPNMKWTSGTPHTQAEVLDVVKLHPHCGPAHSSYVNSLIWNSYNSDSAPQSHSPFGKATFSAINDSAQDVPELDKKDYPHHFCHLPLYQYFS